MGRDQKSILSATSSPNDTIISNYAQKLLKQGKQIFRYDTFGDEAYWGDALRLHQAIAGEHLGGVGPGVSPKTALSVGLKVDVDALRASLIDQLKAGSVNLDDPATTLALLKLNSVVGVGKCAACHVPPLCTEPGNNLHAPSELGVDSFQADRSPTHMYRTAPLAGLWSRQSRGFYHDGRFSTLDDVINHYDHEPGFDEGREEGFGGVP